MKLGDAVTVRRLAIQPVAVRPVTIEAVRRTPLIFNPLDLIQEHVNAAKIKLANHFGSNKPSRKRAVRASLARLIRDARMQGFTDGALYSGKALKKSYLNKIAREADVYAEKIANQISSTTKKGLQKGSAYITSSDRAATIAEFEGQRAYHRGLIEGMGGVGFKKRWVTASDEPCEDCIDNEGEGMIDMENFFQSGHHQPPAHPNCRCALGVHR